MMLEDVLRVVLLGMIGLGALPVVSGVIQFLIVPVHSVVNHYRRAAPYVPRVAVVVPAWNEGLVIGTSIERLIRLEYPPDRLRIYVVDDASTDDTPDVVHAKIARYPGRVFHLRREQGGQGKAHTLNHGIDVILEDDWMEALLIMDADVIYRPDSMRKMARHLADPEVGAVTAYIREGTGSNYLSRFVGYEYIAAQLAARRTANVMGAMACLAGGAQLHSRANLEAIGGRIDTTSLAEDTFTTLRSQLAGRRVVFEPNAVVLAEEPGEVEALWKQRLRWARGNVQITKAFKGLWLNKRRHRGLGGFTFALFWFTTLLLPVLMLLASVGMIGLHFLDRTAAAEVFSAFWYLAVVAYVFLTTMTVQLDPGAGLRAWREALTFPGVISLVIMANVLWPGLVDERVPALFGLSLTPVGEEIWTLGVYSWTALATVAAWGVRFIVRTRFGAPFAPLLVYLVGFGPLLCAITTDAYLKEWQGAAQVWDKTVKTGRVVG